MTGQDALHFKYARLQRSRKNTSDFEESAHRQRIISAQVFAVSNKYVATVAGFCRISVRFARIKKRKKYNELFMLTYWLHYTLMGYIGNYW